MQGDGETFVNGKLLDSKDRLKFGDMFYFSLNLSKLWDPELDKSKIWKLYRRNACGRDFAVFKFKRLTPKGRTQQDNKEANHEDNANSEDFHGSSTNPKLVKHPIFDENSILTKIFEYLIPENNDNQQKDLFNCRLVSKSWNESSLLVLQKNLVLNLTITMDNLIRDPNSLANRLHWKTHRMKGLKFDGMKINIWPQRSTYYIRDNEERDKAVVKFNQDFSAFINHPDFHPVKVLTMNIDYLTPISTLLSKFCHSLEELTIQINMIWIRDENKTRFLETLIFPKLKKLTLEFCQQEEGDLGKIRESKYLAQLLEGFKGIEQLVLKNYAKLPSDFGPFKNLRKITIYGGCNYNVEIFNLLDFLSQIGTLPADQVRSFKVEIDLIDVQVTPVEVEEALLCFLHNQAGSLENLELSARYTQPIKLPRCMPNLKKLWIGESLNWTESEFMWGAKLSSQVTKKSKGHMSEFRPDTLSLVLWDGDECGQESCRTCNDTLAFGRWNQDEREFVCYIPNVENIWAWTQ
ncbi:uncharacterized protein LOC110861179 isoform X2 [Folsomia candida]|uniref:uncharacterized protein LOC110861179 isoform X2 n=1 Tax=Folsomia candida TaxID=158441 RepID=UPI001604D486|nr:uncharacterized protein LOC110861179 isoform X2 [Folsomia candida]